jgi:hypothetical protein
MKQSVRSSARAMAALTAAALGMSGCYTYIPTDLAAAPENAELRVYMSRRALADIPEDIPTGGTFLTGRLARQTPDSILLQVPVSRRVEGGGALDLRQNVFLPTTEIVDVQFRQLNKPRTFISVGGGVVVGALLVLGVIDAGGEPNPPPGQGEDQIRIPFLSFPAP